MLTVLNENVNEERERDDIVVTDLESYEVESQYKPSSDWSMHVIFIKKLAKTPYQ